MNNKDEDEMKGHWLSILLYARSHSWSHDVSGHRGLPPANPVVSVESQTSQIASSVTWAGEGSLAFDRAS